MPAPGARKYSNQQPLQLAGFFPAKFRTPGVGRRREKPGRGHCFSALPATTRRSLQPLRRALTARLHRSSADLVESKRRRTAARKLVLGIASSAAAAIAERSPVFGRPHCRFKGAAMLGIRVRRRNKLAAADPTANSRGCIEASARVPSGGGDGGRPSARTRGLSCGVGHHRLRPRTSLGWTAALRLRPGPQATMGSATPRVRRGPADRGLGTYRGHLGWERARPRERYRDDERDFVDPPAVRRLSGKETGA